MGRDVKEVMREKDSTKLNEQVQRPCGGGVLGASGEQHWRPGWLEWSEQGEEQRCGGGCGQVAACLLGYWKDFDFQSK